MYEFTIAIAFILGFALGIYFHQTNREITDIICANLRHIVDDEVERLLRTVDNGANEANGANEGNEELLRDVADPL